VLPHVAGLCVVPTLLYPFDRQLYHCQKQNLYAWTASNLFVSGFVMLLRETDRQTDGQAGATTLFDLIWFAQVTAVLRVPQEWPTDLKALSACVVSWFSCDSRGVDWNAQNSWLFRYGSLSVLCVQLQRGCTARNSVPTNL